MHPLDTYIVNEIHILYIIFVYSTYVFTFRAECNVTLVRIVKINYYQNVELTKGKNKTKALISLALYQVILKQKGYENITVKDICETAGVSRMSFYRYYNKKDDVFIDYCDERFAEFYEEFFLNGNPTIRTFVAGMFSYFSKYSRQLVILKKANKQNLLMEQFDSYARYLINNWGVLKDRHNAHNNPVIAPFLSGGFFNVLMQWLDGGMKESVEDMTNALFSLFPTIDKD